jgi:thymidylate synthase
MKQYLDLLRDVQDNGRGKEDRTGTGTRSVFGRQIRMNLADGFPLLTTKKMFTRGMLAELLWFLSGDTNEHTLRDQNVNIWREWADPETGELGPVYGHMWRDFGGKPKAARLRAPKLRDGLEASYLGVGCGKGKENHLIGKTWEGMMARCYDPAATSYPTYGAVGVVVCDRWLEFAAFAEDAEKLPGWDLKEESLRDSTLPRYVLDKDLRGDGFTYSPECCSWLTDTQNQYLQADTIYTVEKGGKHYEFVNAKHFCDEHGAESKNFSDLWTGSKNAKVRSGFKFVSKRPARPAVDQIANLIRDLKTNPTSRRHIVTGWDPSMLHLMALPPCHCLFQFYCEELTVEERLYQSPTNTANYYAEFGWDKNLDQSEWVASKLLDDRGVPKYRLSCQLYQRSADIFLGVPMNIASYAALTMMIAQVVNMVPGDFVHTFGDLHIYNNHFDQVAKQLSREPRPLPKLRLNPDVKDLFKFTLNDFTLEGYDPHPTIKAEVSV